MIVALPALGLSNSAAARSKHWIKRLTGVDTSKSDGYAFTGSWEKFGATVEVPEGTWFLEYIEDVAGSGRLRGRDVVLYQAVTVEGDPAVLKRLGWELGPEAGWALQVRDAIASLVNTAPDEAGPDTDPEALRAERERLLVRVREIDQALAGRDDG
jgi:hypothetical protein